VCLRREWNGCVVTQMCLCVCVSGGNGMDVMLHRCVCVCVSGGNGMDVLLHRCVCVCVSQEGMEWMCTNIKKKK